MISRLTTFSADVSRVSIEVGNLVDNRLRTAALREAALDSMDLFLPRLVVGMPT